MNEPKLLTARAYLFDDKVLAIADGHKMSFISLVTVQSYGTRIHELCHKIFYAANSVGNFHYRVSPVCYTVDYFEIDSMIDRRVYYIKMCKIKAAIETPWTAFKEELWQWLKKNCPLTYDKVLLDEYSNPFLVIYEDYVFLTIIMNWWEYPDYWGTDDYSKRKNFFEERFLRDPDLNVKEIILYKTHPKWSIYIGSVKDREAYLVCFNDRDLRETVDFTGVIGLLMPSLVDRNVWFRLDISKGITKDFEFNYLYKVEFSEEEWVKIEKYLSSSLFYTKKH